MITAGGKRGPYKTSFRPVPRDFAVRALDLSLVAMQVEFKAGYRTLARWLDDMPPEWRADRTARMRAKVEQAGRANIRPLTEADRQRAIRAKRGPNKCARFHRGPGVTVDTRPNGMAAEAAHHLRRFYSNVFDAGRVLGPEHAGFFVVGGMRLTANELVAEAKDKGWMPDVWREVAVA